MPLHLDDLDVVPEVAGLSSALIVPCNMCPAVTIALKENKPLIQFFRRLLRSAPFERHISALRSRLRKAGVTTAVFRNSLPHNWFLCMWTLGRSRKLQKRAAQYDAIVVLGCDSASETVRDAVKSTGCKVIQGMEVVGFINAKPKLKFPCDLSFEDGKIIPMSGQRTEAETRG